VRTNSKYRCWSCEFVRRDFFRFLGVVHCIAFRFRDSELLPYLSGEYRDQAAARRTPPPTPQQVARHQRRALHHHRAAHELRPAGYRIPIPLLVCTHESNRCAYFRVLTHKNLLGPILGPPNTPVRPAVIFTPTFFWNTAVLKK